MAQLAGSLKRLEAGSASAAKVAVEAAEKKLSERQARIEAALMQVRWGDGAGTGAGCTAVTFTEWCTSMACVCGRGVRERGRGHSMRVRCWGGGIVGGGWGGGAPGRPARCRVAQCVAAVSGVGGLQVARQVDVLDQRLKEEQEGSLRALEAIMAQSGEPTSSGSPGQQRLMGVSAAH